MKEVGNEQVGILEIPVYGYLRIGEMDEFIQIVSDLNELRESLTNDAKARGKTPGKKGKKNDDAVDLNQLELSKFLLRYSNETATILLKHRIDPEWTLEDTRRLPAPLVVAISNLFREEMTQGGSAVSLADQFAADEEGEKGKATTSTSETPS